MRNPFSEGNCKCQTGSKRKKKTKSKGQKGGFAKPPKPGSSLYYLYKNPVGGGKKSKAQNGGIIAPIERRYPTWTTPGFPTAPRNPFFGRTIMY